MTAEKKNAETPSDAFSRIWREDDCSRPEKGLHNATSQSRLRSVLRESNIGINTGFPRASFSGGWPSSPRVEVGPSCIQLRSTMLLARAAQADRAGHEIGRTPNTCMQMTGWAFATKVQETPAIQVRLRAARNAPFLPARSPLVRFKTLIMLT